MGQTACDVCMTQTEHAIVFNANHLSQGACFRGQDTLLGVFVHVDTWHQAQRLRVRDPHTHHPYLYVYVYACRCMCVIVFGCIRIGLNRVAGRRVVGVFQIIQGYGFFGGKTE
jgi:hypothetical protein